MSRNLEKELRDAWRTNCKINLMILDKVSKDGMAATLSTRGGRGVMGEFAHVHNIRVHHVKNRAPEIFAKWVDKLEVLDTKATFTKVELKKALKASASAIEELLLDVLNEVPKRRGFRKGIFTTLSYLVSHEAHHRGRILLTLKVSGKTIDKDVAMGIWGWDQVKI